MLNRRTFISASAATVTGMALPQMASAYTIPEKHMPMMVNIGTRHAPGEIHVDPTRYYLYWTLPEGQAIRYVVGVGKRGLYESGEFRVGAKREWPSWRPTDEMIERNPKYKEFEDGMPGGPENPLGARALYLFDGNRDTYLRIHGTPQPWTLGRSVSNGCARLANSHVVHLYNQVPKGTRVILYPQG